MYLRGNIDDNHLCQQHWCILLSWAAGSFSLTLLLFSLFKMTMRTSLLYRTVSSMIMSLAVTATLIEMFWCMTTFQKSVILHVWQFVQLTEINTLWLWIRITLMYDDWWVLIWFNRIQSCTNKTFTSNSMRMPLVWEKWVYWVSCCWSTKRTESSSTVTRVRAATYTL
jgi:hypothetical protein